MYVRVCVCIYYAMNEGICHTFVADQKRVCVNT